MKTKTILILIAVLQAIILSPCILVSCSKATAPVSTEASFSGNTQDSGIVSANKDGFTVKKVFIERWDDMVANYGDLLSPPRKKGDRKGITEKGDLYLMDAQAMDDFLTLNSIRKNRI